MDKKSVTYEEFGAVGDGKTNDFAALYRAHVYANENKLPVKANDSATYYICEPLIDGEVKSIPIKTSVEWGSASFIIDDTTIKVGEETNAWRGTVIFVVLPDEPKYKIEDRETLEKIEKAGLKPGSTKVDLKLDYPAMIVPYSSGHLVFRRLGYGGWRGSPKHELIVIDKDGNISPETPLMFEYDVIDYIEVIRLDVEPITISGGVFTTLANCENTLISGGGYINRGIRVSRSYTTVKGVSHYIKGELPMSKQVNEAGEVVCVCPPYQGFYLASYGDHITFLDCVISGRRCYNRPTGGATGTYGLSGDCVNKIVFKGCRQANFWVTVDENHDIHPATEDTPGAITSMSGHVVNGKGLMMHWGIGGTNFCKNMEYIDCQLSRFDAHQGLYHGKIVNSTVNGIEVVGNGELLLENSRLFGRYGGKTAGAGNSLIYLRGDYASTWDGEIKLKDFTAYERITEDAGAFVFYHSYNNWNFGYQAKFPNLCIENLKLRDLDTKEPLPAGTTLRLMGNSLEREPMMHAENTFRVNTIFPDVDEDGDGLVDGTNIPYDDVVSNRGVKDPTSLKNVNPIMPPKYIKVIGNTEGYKLAVQDTSEYEGGGFFGKTEFIGDNNTYVGTATPADETFVFERLELTDVY